MAHRPDRHRRTQKKWMLRIADSEQRTDIRCALCNERAPPVAIASRFSEAGLLEHLWCCSACGNQWTTSNKRPP
jgi:hypothetical protein